MHLFMARCLLHLFPRVSLIFTSQFAPCYTGTAKRRDVNYFQFLPRSRPRARRNARAGISRTRRETSGLFFINYSLVRFRRNQFALLFLSALDERRGAARKKGGRKEERKKEKKKERKEKGAFPISDPSLETRRFLSSRVQLGGKY